MKNVDLTALARERAHAKELAELRNEYRSGLQDIQRWSDEQDDLIERRYMEDKSALASKTNLRISEHKTRYSRRLRTLDEKYAGKKEGKNTTSQKQEAVAKTTYPLPPHPPSSVEIHHNSYWRDQRS